MTENAEMEEKTGYGTLGLDVGVFGHWARLITGALLVALVGVNVGLRFTAGSDALRWLMELLGYFTGTTVLYSAVYWFLGERGILERVGAWTVTAIFVGPALVIAWWDILIGPFTGIRLPGTLTLAMLAYIGLSFLLQWRLRYGGCEVVALPILLFRKRYPSYCIPLVALDAVEKAVVDRQAVQNPQT